MKHFLLTPLLCLFGISVMAQTTVEPFVPGSTVEGVTYFLPKTAVRVVFTMEKTVTTPGEFYKYAFKYLRLQNVPEQTSTSWKIKKVELQPYGVPDSTKAYSIKLKSKTVAPLVGLSKEGLLLSINTECTEFPLPDLPEGTPAATPVNPRNYMNQEILQAGSSAKMAELCAQEIYDIRDSRNALIRGEAENTPKDGAQLKLMIDQLDIQAEALESLFKGTTQTSTEIFTMTIIPGKAMEKDILCRFSQKLGLVDADDLSGSPVYIKVEPTETLPARVDDEKAEQKKDKMTEGVCYNVPVRTKLEVFDSSHAFASMETPMAQFGSVEVLSNTLFDKKTTTKVTFFQSTGGVQDVME